jgi:hypothetical protein
MGRGGLCPARLGKRVSVSAIRDAGLLAVRVEPVVLTAIKVHGLFQYTGADRVDIIGHSLGG